MSARHSFLSTTGLLRSPSTTSLAPSTHAPSSGTKLGKILRSHRRTPNDISPAEAVPLQPRRLCGDNGIIPLGPMFIVGIAIVMSLFFIGAISFAFIGAEDELVFKDVLNEIADRSPGIVLIGDNVDVDIDEPAVTIRWSILACGANFALPGSEGSHGSSSCGIPVMALHIYADSDESPTAVYDPTQLPFTSGTGDRLRIQNLHQFDSDHVLDVHEARLYPFDTYHLTSTLRAVTSADNDTIPITRLLTISDTSSFIISPSDSASYVVLSNSSTEATQLPSRNLDMEIRRPGEARFFALMLFGVNWMLAHATIAYVALAWKSDDTERVMKYLVFCIITMLVVPQVRNAMPDAPGLDGILIDQIGFFAQMLTTAIAIIMLLAMLARRELTLLEAAEPVKDFVKEKPAPISQGLHKLRAGSSTSIDFRHMRNLSKTFSSRVIPPSPIKEHPDASPFGDHSVIGSQTASSRLGPPKFAVNGQTGSSRPSRPSNNPYSEWV